MIEISQRAGIPVEVYAFIGSSPIRQLAEEWDVDLMRQALRRGDRRRREGRPARRLRHRGHDALAARGARRRSSRWRSITARIAPLPLRHRRPRDAGRRAQPHPLHRKHHRRHRCARVGIDWHGHNDRGLALENALWALEFGADRVHGTALGIGERVGNAQMELILLNLKLLGLLEHQDLTHLLEYCQTVARAVRLARSRSTTRSSGATRSAPPPACTPPRSSRPRRRATRGSPIASTPACPPGCSGASRRSASATCPAPRT